MAGGLQQPAGARLDAGRVAASAATAAPRSSPTCCDPTASPSAPARATVWWSSPPWPPAKPRTVAERGARRRRRAPDRTTRATSASAPTTLPPGSAASVEEEIVVTPAATPGAAPSVVAFERDSGDFATPPQLGDDALSAVAVLPGAASADGSGQLNVRGGDGDDVLVMLDGLELVRPYHLADFDNAVSFVTPRRSVARSSSPAAIPAQYGDRMGGVVDLTTRSPTPRRHFSLGLEHRSTPRARCRTSWASGRAGCSPARTRLAISGRSSSSGLDEHPRYWDAFGKLDVDLSPSHTVVADVLVARDSFELSSEHRAATRRYDSAGTARYAWIRAHRRPRPRPLRRELVGDRRRRSPALRSRDRDRRPSRRATAAR